MTDCARCSSVEAEDEARLAALRQAAKIGREDFAAGRYRSFADGDALRRHLTGRACRVLGHPRG